VLVPNSDQTRINTERRRAWLVVRDPFDVQRSWMEDHSIQVVPVPTGGHFSGSQSDHLADAFRLEGCDHLVAIAVEEMIDDPWIYYLDATTEDIEDFSFTCGASSFVLLPTELELPGALCTVNDYALIFGPITFLERFLFPRTISDARKEFQEVYESYPSSNRQSLSPALQYL